MAAKGVVAEINHTPVNAQGEPLLADKDKDLAALTDRIIGVMESKGTVLGFDLDDTVYIPAARALELFNRDSLFEILDGIQTGRDEDLYGWNVEI